MEEKSLFYYIGKYAGPQKKNFIISVILAIIGVLFSLLPYICIAFVIKNLMSGETDFTIYLKLLGISALAWIFRVYFHTVSTNLSHITTFKILGDIRKKISDLLADMPLGSVTSYSSGTLKNIIVERVDSMETTLAHVIPEFSANLFAPVVMFIFLFTIDWRMAFISLLTLPIAVLCMMYMMKDYAPRFKRTQDTTKALNDIAVEYIEGIEVIKAFSKTESTQERFSKAAKENAYSFIDWMRPNALPHSIAATISPSTLLVILPIGGIFVLTTSLSLTDFIMVIILGCGLVTPILSLATYMDDMQKTSFIFGEIDKLLSEEKLERPNTSEKLPKSYGINLKDIHFSYKQTEVLHGMSLDIAEKSVTALVGPSGSGKSTIAKLIASLWDPNSGSISIGGVNIREISLNDFYSLVSYVSQDTFLFNTSVRENIRLGNPQASDKDVEEIAKKSGCYDFICELEDGFDTQVGSSGAHLSGGEQQRISLARAMLKNAPILILDEATAYTDPENEATIQRAVAKLAKDKTLVVIAHRLSTIKDADKIVVIENGSINAQGGHETLLSSSGLYRRMWEAHISAKDSYDNDTKKEGDE